jgi:hypothetical protein
LFRGAFFLPRVRSLSAERSRREKREGGEGRDEREKKRENSRGAERDETGAERCVK